MTIDHGAISARENEAESVALFKRALDEPRDLHTGVPVRQFAEKLARQELEKEAADLKAQAKERKRAKKLAKLRKKAAKAVRKGANSSVEDTIAKNRRDIETLTKLQELARQIA